MPAQPVFTGDFETPAPRREGGEGDAGGESGGCRQRPRPDREGHALEYLGAAPYRCVWLIPVEPGAHYAVSRSIHTDDPAIDLVAVESLTALAHPEAPNDPRDLAQVLNETGRFLASHTALYTHRFPSPPRDHWRRDALHVFTSPYTHTLVVMLSDAQALLSAKPREAWLDDVEVRHLAPSPEQELALWKGFAPAADADASLGIAKHAQLLPIRGEQIEPPYDANYEFRHALFAPADTTIRWPLHVPPHARLHFSCALFKASRPGDAALFRVVVERGDTEAELFRLRLALDPAGRAWYWHDARVDLSAYAGEDVTLRLETRAAGAARGYALWGAPIVDTPRRPDEPPNVLLIGVDTLRADRLGSYGYARDTSPHIDALAADGVRFERAISNSNWTAPSFASLLTGLVPSQHLVVHRTASIASATTTLAERFRAAGWLTRGIAYKPYLYNMGFEQGFDTWFGVPAASSTADPVIGKAIQWLSANGSRRFFLFLHFNDPHQPFNQPEPFRSRFASARALADLGLEFPLYTSLDGHPKGCASCVRDGRVVDGFKSAASDLYDGEVAYLDDRIGRLISFLERRGWYRDTAIAFTADHGEMLYERGDHLGHGGDWFTDEVVRVPLIVVPQRRFGPVRRGAVVREPVSGFDVMPTLLELAGIAPDPAELPAHSLVPALRDPAAGAGARAAVSESVRFATLAVAKRGWKYVLRMPPGRPSAESLFHVDSDPAERADVSARHPGVVAELRADAADYLLANRAGHYLLVTGGGGDERIRVATRGVPLARSLLGLPLRDGGPDGYAFAGAARGLVLLAVFEAGPDSSIALEGGPEAVFGRYTPGALQRALADPARRVQWFHTEPRVEPAAPRADDPEQLEALKALGYVE